MISATLFGSDGPAEAKIFSLQRIQMWGINSIAALDCRRRTYFPVLAGTVSAVNMVRIGQTGVILAWLEAVDDINSTVSNDRNRRLFLVRLPERLGVLLQSYSLHELRWLHRLRLREAKLCNRCAIALG